MHKTLQVECLTFLFTSSVHRAQSWLDMEASGDGDESPTRETPAEAEGTMVPFDVHWQISVVFRETMLPHERWTRAFSV